MALVKNRHCSKMRRLLIILFLKGFLKVIYWNKQTVLQGKKLQKLASLPDSETIIDIRFDGLLARTH